jgi:hypothetical protein
VKKALLSWLGLLAGAALWAADPDYQRYDLVREPSELLVEGSFHYWTEETDAHDFHTMRLGVSAEYAFKTSHSVSFSLPYTLGLYNNPDSRQKEYYSFGDLRLSYEYLKRFNHINLFFGPLVMIPLAEQNEYAAREGVYSASDGRYSIGAGVSVTGIRDPVVWNAGFQYTVGLPKQERFYRSWQPGNMQLSAGFSDLLNYRFGFSFALTQQIDLPAIMGDHIDPAGVRVLSRAKGELMILFETDTVRVSVETSLYPINRPFLLGLVYGHKFDLSAKSGDLKRHEQTR